MDKDVKKMPMGKPLIYAYTVYGFFFSVINEKDMGWVFNNFIQIMYHDDWQMPVYEIHTDILYNCPLLRCRAQLFEGDEKSFINSIISGIDNDCYCNLFLDWVYVNEGYNGGSFAHSAVITGYDKEHELFDIYDNFDSGRFVVRQVSFENTAKAFFSAGSASVGNINDNDESDSFSYLRNLYFIRYNEEFTSRIDKSEILTQIDSYLCSRRNYANTEENITVYGISVYDRLIEKLNVPNKNLTRDLHFLYEHKLLIYKILDRLFADGVFRESDSGILKDYEKLCKDHLVIRNIYIKDHLIKSPRAENISDLQKKLKELQRRESEYLSALLNSCRSLLKYNYYNVREREMKEQVFKPSLYNVMLDDKNENIILANTLTGVVRKYHSDSRERIMQLLEMDAIEEKNGYIDELAENGFIVPLHTDEKALADHNFYRVFYDNSVLDLMIVPTDACNMRCSYCYEPHTPHVMSEQKTEALKKYLKKMMRTVKYVNITWFGGEPLLKTEIIYDVMKKVQELSRLYKIPVSGSVVTNGYLLDSETFENLYSCGVRSFQITIDGFKETHNHYRPLVTNEDSYDRIISNLKYILGTKRRAGVIIRTNVPSGETDERIEFIDYIKKEFLFDSRFSLSVMNVRDYGGEGVRDVKRTRYSNLNRIIDHCFENDINPIGSGQLSIYNLCCEHAAINSFYIDYDLSVYKCSDIIYSEFRDCGRVGSIDESGNMELDEHKLAAWMQKCYNRPACYRCDYYPLCYSHHCPYDLKYRKCRGCDDFKANIDYKIRSQVYGSDPIRIQEVQDGRKVN